jgi:metal-responsive CopG/Arc/MetJ family transcriptional regulator
LGACEKIKQNLEVNKMTNNKQNNDAMPSKGVRLRVDQWEDCDKFYESLGLASRNDFIRDAVDFYIEYLRHKNSVKFLTPALESVISSKIRDSEDRLARLLFKLAVDQNLLAHIVADTYNIDSDAVDEQRIYSIREVKETNGTLRVDEIIGGD